MTSNSTVHSNTNKNTNKRSIIALLPFIVFLGVFLGTGIILTLQGVEFAFYQLLASIAIIPGIFVALYLGKVVAKETIDKQISQFINGGCIFVNSHGNINGNHRRYCTDSPWFY